MTTADNTWLAAQFEAHRPHLRAVAYRMLGSLDEADDAVQDAWLRLNRSDAAAIENMGAWLTTVVARLALDMLRARNARREELMSEHFPDPIVTAAETPDAVDPEEQVLLADSIGLAMLVVLESLSPAERLAFVLHDMFGLPFDEIAPIVDRSPTSTRQLASRARRRVRRVAPPSDTPRARQRELVEVFQAASRDGDFEALLRVLDPDVVIRAHVGTAASVFGQRREVRGADAVARQALAFRALAPGARPATVNGTAGGVVFTDGRPFAVLGFTFANDRITEIDILAEPHRLARLDLSAVVP